MKKVLAQENSQVCDYEAETLNIHLLVLNLFLAL